MSAMTIELTLRVTLDGDDPGVTREQIAQDMAAQLDGFIRAELLTGAEHGRAWSWGTVGGPTMTVVESELSPAKDIAGYLNGALARVSGMRAFNDSYRLGRRRALEDVRAFLAPSRREREQALVNAPADRPF